MADAKGIDVSNVQGSSFDWAAEKGRISFAFIKATEGITYIDPDFARNWRQARGIGIVRGAYHFGHPSDAADSSARAFLAEVRGQGLYAGDMLALDLEVTDGRTPAEVSAFARAWCAFVAGAAGRKPVVYTNLSFAEAGNCAGLGGYPLWIAEWSAPAGRPSVPAPWTNWAFHQYTDSPIDQDVFHGDEAALLAFAGLRPAPKEEEVQSGQLNNGANAITIVNVPWGSGTNIGFGCDNGRQGLPPAKIRVAIYDTYWHIYEETVDSTKGQTVVQFPNPAKTGVISIERQDAGNVVVGYEVS